MVKNSPPNAGDARDLGFIPGLGRFLGVEMTTHSTILAWKILWTEESGGCSPWGDKESDTTDHSIAQQWLHVVKQVKRTKHKKSVSIEIDSQLFYQS